MDIFYESADPEAVVLDSLYPRQLAQEILSELVDEILDMNTSLARHANTSREAINICFVIDGEPLPAKHATHAKRKRISQLSQASESKMLTGIREKSSSPQSQKSCMLCTC